MERSLMKLKKPEDQERRFAGKSISCAFSPCHAVSFPFARTQTHS